MLSEQAVDPSYELHQNEIAGIMPMAVIDRLEMVDVERLHAQRVASQFR